MLPKGVPLFSASTASSRLRQDDARQGAEDVLLRDLHRRLDTVEDRGPEEEAVRVLHNLHRPAVCDDPCGPPTRSHRLAGCFDVVDSFMCECYARLTEFKRI